MVKYFRLNDKVLNTHDPGQWYRSSKTVYERGQFFENFNRLNNVRNSGSHIALLSILRLVCNENVYINNITALLIAN